jgi:hypothetical protein
MAKKPHRSMAEYKEIVDQARARRKKKENENKQLMEQNGSVVMCLQQEMLMNASVRGIETTRVCRLDHDVMNAIVVPMDHDVADVSVTATGQRWM